MDQEGDSYLNLKGSIGWSESTLNRGVLATRGHSQSVTLEATLPGSDLSFFKVDYRGQLFTPVTDNYTLRFHTELGYGDGYGSTSGLPFYENYYAGGFSGSAAMRVTAKDNWTITGLGASQISVQSRWLMAKPSPPARSPQPISQSAMIRPMNC